MFDYDQDKMREIYAKSSDNELSKKDSASLKKQTQNLYKTQM